MKYLSVCSGIEAATVAWHPLGWTPAAFAEIERFPSAVLAHHYPDVPNLGDMTRYREWPDELRPDLLVGGTPCQSFSVAGLRAGLADPRGNLALTFLGLVDRYRPRWVVWENVPGVRSSGSGRDFGAFLGGLAELGYGGVYRSLDAQYFGLAQRRERMFVVGHLGDWRAPATVLFEPACLSGHPAPRRQAGERVTPTLDVRAGRSGETGFHTSGGLVNVAPTIPSRPTGGGGLGTDFDLDGGLIPQVANPLTARMHKGINGINTTCDEGQTMVAHALRAEGFDAGEDDTGRGTRVVAFEAPAVAVRRLTPRECERLQGFPDDYTLIPYRGKPAADGPRYKALGNSMAVPVMRWIGERIAAVAAGRVEVAA